MSEWQPIETAPKDGSRLLGYWPGVSLNGQPIPFDVAMVAWGERLGWHCPMSGDEFGEPTHWMPLPGLPK